MSDRHFQRHAEELSLFALLRAVPYELYCITDGVTVLTGAGALTKDFATAHARRTYKPMMTHVR